MNKLYTLLILELNGSYIKIHKKRNNKNLPKNLIFRSWTCLKKHISFISKTFKHVLLNINSSTRKSEAVYPEKLSQTCSSAHILPYSITAYRGICCLKRNVLHVEGLFSHWLQMLAHFIELKVLKYKLLYITNILRCSVISCITGVYTLLLFYFIQPS